MTTAGAPTLRRQRVSFSRRGCGPSRRLGSLENTATSAVSVASVQFSVNGRPSDAVEGGVTSVSLTSTDDGSVSGN